MEVKSEKKWIEPLQKTDIKAAVRSLGGKLATTKHLKGMQDPSLQTPTAAPLAQIKG